MNAHEIRIELTEEILRELMWRALVPEALVVKGTLQEAIMKSSEELGSRPEEFRITGVTIVMEDKGVFAEVEYMPLGERATS